jgi:hypothetical protein
LFDALSGTGRARTIGSFVRAGFPFDRKRSARIGSRILVDARGFAPVAREPLDEFVLEP